MRMKTTNPRILIATAFTVISLVISLGGQGCATPPRAEKTPTLGDLDRDPRVLNDSELDLVYLLGHDRHQFRVEAKNDKIHARALDDKSVLREGDLNPLKYRELFKRVATFTSAQTTRTPAGNKAGCRSPFLVRARVGDSTYLLNGCRHTETGTTFGQITRDAEFMLASPALTGRIVSPTQKN